MKKRLCIGIQELNSSWRSILEQTGVWFEEVNYASELSSQYSVVILNKNPDDDQVKMVADFLSQGGSVLEMGNVHVFTRKHSVTHSEAKTLINESKNAAFKHIGWIDLYAPISLHNDSSLFKGLVHIQKFNSGILGFIGLDFPKLIHSIDYTRKRFFNPVGGDPDEIVSKVSKHEIMELLTAVLKELHIQQGLPFVNKWNSPQKNPVFCFRIDSDYGDQKSMDKIYELAKKYRLSLTWFLHVEAHEEWLNHFQEYENQEIALHGYAHGTSKSREKVHANIDAGYHLLVKNGFNPHGFCAPYGIWNTALKETLKDFEFDYTSEFTFGYDGLPIHHADKTLPLQIPLHPICTGSLNRKKVALNQMAAYFGHIIRNKMSRFEPVVLYHHPMQTGLQAIEKVFSKVKDEELTNLSFGDFARFWKKRNSTSFQAFYDDGVIYLSSEPAGKLFLQVSTNHHGFDLASLSKSEFSIPDSPEFEYSKPYLPSTEEIRDMHKKDLRLLKTNILDWKNRNRL